MRSASFSVGTMTLTLPKSSGVGCWGSIGGWRLGPFNKRENRIAVAGTCISSNKREIALSTIKSLSFVICHWALGIGHWALGIGHGLFSLSPSTQSLTYQLISRQLQPLLLTLLCLLVQQQLQRVWLNSLTTAPRQESHLAISRVTQEWKTQRPS